MDVTCERCGTEYEFDETLLSARGTSVKCTNCGHVFKVFPRGVAESDPAANTWQLKLRDGSIDTIDSLRELQRRIGAGELTPANEIARGDDGWKPLGSIPELETFFQAAGTPVAEGSPAAAAPPSSRPPAEGPRESSLPPGRRPRQPTLLGVMPVQKLPDAGAVSGGGTDPGFMAASESVTEEQAEGLTEAGVESLPELDALSPTEPASEFDFASASAADSVPGPALDSALESDGSSPQEPSSADDSYQSPYHSDSFADTALAPAAEPIEDAVFEERPVASSRPSTPPPAYFDDDDDIPELPGRSSSPLRWLLLIVAIGALALVIAQWHRVALLIGIGADPALIASGMTEGEAGLAAGDADGYADAIEAYGRAVEAGGDRDPEVLAKLSNAYALAAQARIDTGVTEQEVEGLRTAALSTAEAATELDPRVLEAKLALADALRLTGSSAEARSTLENARSMSFSRTAELYRIDARLSAAEAGGRLENGLRSARQAAELAPESARYLLLLARAERAAGNDERAIASLEAVLANDPEQSVAKELLAEIQAANAEAAADAGVQMADAGAEASASAGATDPVADAGGAPDAGTTPEEAAPEEPVGDKSAPKAAKPSVKAAPAPKKTKPTPAPKPARKPAPRKEPRYDEYDQLAQAAGSDEFVDGRPPVRDYDWYMKEGRAELAAGSYARARAFFDSALEVRPGSADAMDGLGQVAAASGDDASALRYYRVAAQRGHPDGYFNLGKAYERLGKNEEAVSAYYTYVTRRPRGAHATAARAAIKRLEPRAKLPPVPEGEPGGEPSPKPESAGEPESEAEAEPDAKPTPAKDTTGPQTPPSAEPAPSPSSEQPAKGSEPEAP